MSTASALERELQCPTSAALSPVILNHGEDAERGHVIHTFCRSVIAGTPRAIALAAVPEGPWRETCEQIDFAILCGDIADVRAEVAYRINIETDEVTELGLNLNRRYPPRAANEIDGTNDFEGRRPITNTLVVTDIKTGFHLVTTCKENPQMRFHARALMLRHEVDVVEARIAYIDVGGTIRFDTHVFTRFELDVFNDDLLRRRERIAKANEALKGGGRVEVSTGSWCTYCPVKVSCPHYTELARAMLGDLRTTHAKWATLTADERAAATMQAYEVRDLAVRIIGTMQDIARTEPIALPGGKELRETAAGVRVVNAPKGTASRRRRTAA